MTRHGGCGRGGATGARGRGWLAVLLLGGWLLGFSAGVAAASALTPPQQAVQQISDRLQETMRRDGERIRRDGAYARQVAAGFLDDWGDLERMAVLVLGEYWRKATPQQRDAFLQEFRGLLVRSYGGVLQSLGRWELHHSPHRLAAGASETRVASRVVQGGRSDGLPVETFLRKGDGQWRVFDLAVQGVSVGSGLRLGFQVQLQFGGLDALIARLAAMNRGGVTAIQPLGPG
jgi:phospholipid transport system substrate-binding protein